MTDKRKDTPSLLDQLSTGKAYQNPPEAPKQHDVKTEKQESDKVKLTHYVTPETAARVDFAQARLRQMTRDRGRKLSKSALAEAALKLALDDFEANGENSRIFDYLDF